MDIKYDASVVPYDHAKAVAQGCQTYEETTTLKQEAMALYKAARQFKRPKAEHKYHMVHHVYARIRSGEMLAKIEKAEGGRPRKTGSSTEPVLSTYADLNVDKKDAFIDQSLAKIPEAIFDDRVANTDEITIKKCMAWAKEFKQKADLNLDDCSLFQMDIQKYPALEAGSVDIIITDPPYPRPDLYETLAQCGQHVLKDGGSLLAMATQKILYEIHASMSKYLEYQWTIAYLTPGGQSAWMPHVEYNVNTFWKPVLWFVKGKYSGRHIGDVVKSAVNDNQKALHFWGQSVSGFLSLVDRFTTSGDMVLDPFLGGGTTAFCALKLGCKFQGFDIDEKYVFQTLEYLNQWGYKDDA